MHQHQFRPDLPPPANTVGLVGWLRKHLFSNIINTCLTLILGYLASWHCGTSLTGPFSKPIGLALAR